MKITAGLGSIDEYIEYVKAGADEMFLGYVPERWMQNGGLNWPLNRREVLYYNVQIGSHSEMEILAELVRTYRVPVSVALNSLYYPPRLYPLILDIIEECMELGFCSFIVADPALLLKIAGLPDEKRKKIRIHVSGEMAEINRYTIEYLRQFPVERIIFHRKNTPEDMKAMIQQEAELHPKQTLEYEAFALNEKCLYNGAFCNSLHCDELTHICHLPCKGEQTEEIKDVLGAGGCGLCALWKLREAGVTYLKLVSRGNYADATIRDVRCLKQAVTLLEKSKNEAEYIQAMKQKLFPDGCSLQCYYPEN